MFNLISTNEKNFIKKCLNNNPPIREDKRNPFDYRQIQIRKLAQNGQIEVKLGKTLVISQIIPKLVKPFPDHPSEGQIVFAIDTYHLKPNADYNSQNESLNEFRTKINNFLEMALKQSKALDANTLCIIPSKLVWKIVIDVTIINNDGNVLDACLISVLSSWLTYRIPFFILKNNKLSNNGKYVYLTTLHKPYIVSLGIFNNKQFFCDCNLKEESVMHGFISVAANIFGEVVYMKMTSNLQISLEEMNDLLLIVKDKVDEINKTVKTFVDSERKKDSNIISEDVEMEDNTKDEFTDCIFLKTVKRETKQKRNPFNLLKYEID